ncbi:Uncharacterised protein [Mycobacteroides abscessus]|nr:Uncharacterised protein [Mycobacteroides abscessus]
MVRTSASSSRSSARSCACRGVNPPLPPTYTFQPLSVAMTPTSLPRASAHSRAHPETPSLILCGERRPRYRSSSSTAMPTESCTPNRHHVDPTHDFTVRSDLPYAWPDSNPCSTSRRQMCGSCSMRAPNMSMRWPPVIFV